MAVYRRLVYVATALTLVVVVVGAYVRLSDAGLGCPDWPGCYGHLDVPDTAAEIAAAHAAYPDKPLDAGRAWKEMAHRYIAGALGVLILVIAVAAWRMRARLGQAPWLATALVGVVGVQALLGKWTVTMLLKPAIVTGHLIGGMTTLALLCWLALRQGSGFARRAGVGLRWQAGLGLGLLAGQIVLGGWVSTNYAALACTDLPTCQGAWVPAMDFDNAFHLVRELGMTAAGAPLELPALTAIHWAHRLGAIVVAAWLGVLAVRLGKEPGYGLLAVALLVALLIQVSLGLANIWFSLPLPVAVAHNGGAAVLLMLLVTINYRVRVRTHQPGWR